MPIAHPREVISTLLLALLDPVPIDLKPVLATEAVSFDADDPAIWVHPRDASKSIILGTDKQPKEGALYVFGLDGKIKQKIGELDQPNNVDVEYSVATDEKKIDIAVFTERGKSRLRIFSINRANGNLTDVTGSTAAFEGQQGEQAAPMGIALYRRPKDGTVFAIVSRKEGPKEGYLWQYRLQPGQDGKIDAVKVREFGLSVGDEIEALAVDDATGLVFAAEEKTGIRVYSADPDAPDANKELDFFGRDGFAEDREGLAILGNYVVCTDQKPENSEYRLFPKTGDRKSARAVFRCGADSTDGIEIETRPLGPKFPNGIMVVMNSKGKNFLIVDLAPLKATK